MTTVIETVDLGKTYNGSVEALKSLNMTVSAGESIGFLGPNGAGKTTTIQILLNLIRATTGEAFLFGEPMEGQARRLLQNVGALVEMPGFYEQLTPEDTLRYVCRTYGMSKADTTVRIKEVLDEVLLGDVRFKKVGTFSTGMKRRLGIAQVLVHDPQLLIFDEPTNGLDPRGVREMRDLIKSINRSGKTIFLTSHNLTEVNDISERVVFLDHGVKVADEHVHDLKSRLGSKLIEVKFLRPLTTSELETLHGLEHVTNVTQPDQTIIEYDGEVDTTADILQSMTNEALPVYSFAPRSMTIEDMYLSIFGGRSDPKEGGA